MSRESAFEPRNLLFDPDGFGSDPDAEWRSDAAHAPGGPPTGGRRIDRSASGPSPSCPPTSVGWRRVPVCLTGRAGAPGGCINVPAGCRDHHPGPTGRPRSTDLLRCRWCPAVPAPVRASPSGALTGMHPGWRTVGALRQTSVPGRSVSVGHRTGGAKAVDHALEVRTTTSTGWSPAAKPYPIDSPAWVLCLDQGVKRRREHNLARGCVCLKSSANIDCIT